MDAPHKKKKKKNIKRKKKVKNFKIFLKTFLLKIESFKKLLLILDLKAMISYFFILNLSKKQKCSHFAGLHDVICNDPFCCSRLGWCGIGDPWCGKGCQPNYGSCESSSYTTT